MKDLNSVIGGLGKSGLLSGLGGGLAGGALVGALTTKGGRKMGKKVVQVGALAAVGGLAWKAYKTYTENKALNQTAANPSAAAANPANHVSPANAYQGQPAPAAQAPAGMAPFSSSSAISHQRFEEVVADQETDSGQLLLLRAMIAAANADGHIDNDEKARIFERVEQMELSTSDKAALFDELRNPMPMYSLVALVPNAEAALEVYAASLLAIDESQQASAHYLQQLAKSLALPEDLIATLHSDVAALRHQPAVSA